MTRLARTTGCLVIGAAVLMPAVEVAAATTPATTTATTTAATAAGKPRLRHVTLKQKNQMSPKGQRTTRRTTVFLEIVAIRPRTVPEARLVTCGAKPKRFPWRRLPLNNQRIKFVMGGLKKKDCFGIEWGRLRPPQLKTVQVRYRLYY
ncbi:hypothetical protein SMC26_13485 [Actinomadura fulvescens]|uniref:Secreted protein n=1 Tax=Actinomadura fulvescens TaxID=46160 RepID=A0ABN3PKF8_9ACTN